MSPGSVIYLTLHDLLTATVSELDGAIVVSLTLKDYGIELNFYPRLNLDIVEYWELLGPDKKVLDRAVTTQNRKEFFLFRIIGKKISGTVKDIGKFTISFEDGHQLLIHFDPSAQKDERRRKEIRLQILYGDYTS